MFLMCVCQQDCTGEVEVWHDDVRFYKIFDKNGNIYLFILIVYSLSVSNCLFVILRTPA